MESEGMERYGKGRERKVWKVKVWECMGRYGKGRNGKKWKGKL